MPKSNQNGIVKLTKVGRKQATIFSGFCNYHDNDTFEEIENVNFNEIDWDNPRTLLLYSLRAISRENWAKKSGISFLSKIDSCIRKDDSESLKETYNDDHISIKDFSPYWTAHGRQHLKGLKKLVSRINKIFESIRTILRNGKKFHLWQTKKYLLNCKPLSGAASVFSPQKTPNGSHIQKLNLKSEVADIIINILPLPSEHLIMLTYHKNHKEKLLPLFDELDSLDSDKQEIIFSKILIMHCENMVLSPRIVECWNDRTRREFDNCFDQTITSEVDFDKIPNINLFRIDGNYPQAQPE